MNTGGLFSTFSNEQETKENTLDSKIRERSKLYKNKSYNEFLEFTQEKVINLRNQQREDLFKLRREQKNNENLNKSYTNNNTLDNNLTVVSKDLYNYCQNLQIVNEDNLDEFLELFKHTELVEKYKGLIGISKILSLEEPSIEKIVENEFIFYSVRLMSEDYHEFNFEALMCFKKLCKHDSSYYTIYFEKGILSCLYRLIESHIPEIQEMAISSIGDIIGESVRLRDKAVLIGIFDKLIRILNNLTNIISPLFKSTIWAISCFYRGLPKLKYDIICKPINTALDILIKLNRDFENSATDVERASISKFKNETNSNICWIIAYSTEHYSKCLNLISNEHISIIVKLINNQDVLIQLASLRIIGNLIYSDKNNRLRELNNEIITILKRTIFSSVYQIKKETCWILSNLSSGSKENLIANTNSCLVENDILPILIRVNKEEEKEIKDEALWAICNLTELEGKSYIEYLLINGIIEILFENIQVASDQSTLLILEAIDKLLENGRKYFTIDNKNAIVGKIIELGCADILEKLQYHTSEIIYDKVGYIIDTYFETEN